MIQLDRLVYATTKPDEVDSFLRRERGLSVAATGTSFPGVATRIYPLPGGGFLEVTSIEDQSQIAASEGGSALQQFLAEKGAGYYSLILETDRLVHVKKTLKSNFYPTYVTTPQEAVDPTGQTIRFQMVGSAAHLPWFVQYNQPRVSPESEQEQGVILYSPFWQADTNLLEKIFGQKPDRSSSAVSFRMSNGCFRVVQAAEESFAYFDKNGILFPPN
ncbi:VOC family protein [Brevibacillus fulvus]|uniref:Glyoxalase-like domain-containing protein n=1 Tax=Brevibacillus fulvus TaxID=1125967 RepID=A0A938XXC4_9BACL|nr:VOC family protein [Brevibacillus fulvus]MBM7589884.1 hypothetical protein [Brevibacillus fulvus]